MRPRQNSAVFNFPYIGVALARHCFIVALLFHCHPSLSQQSSPGSETLEVGVASVDITPEGPIRMAGYAVRSKQESEGSLQRLKAKAIAIGSDAQGASILITLDLIGIPGHVTTKLAERLAEKMGLDPAQLVLCATHTHSGPEVGNLLNILQYRDENSFSDSLLPLNQLVHITQYLDQLSRKLEQVCLDAMKDRKPARVAWGQGQALFAKNRRTPGGPVDVALPILRVTEITGKLRAVLVNYACHGTTLTGDVNKMHGDWMGEAQRLIETNHPGALAMVAIGCGADADPQPRGSLDNVAMHGLEISKNVERLLSSPLRPITTPPIGRMKWVKLPFSHVPDMAELIKQTEDNSIRGYYARLALDRLARGYPVPTELRYPVQTWVFGNDLVMINLAGEVVVDYSTRLKDEIGADRVWINAYANDVPCYIASKRVVREGGYEAVESMYYYDKPSAFAEDVEDIIIEAVHDLLPAAYNGVRVLTNHPEVVHADATGAFHLSAEVADAIGPEIKYMSEWKAFGWFTEADRVEWKVEVAQKGKFDVYLDWSVSDNEAGKPFVVEAAGQQFTGKIGKTGSWFTYRNERIGRIRLPAGSQKVVFKPSSASPKGALLDLRSLRLVPVK